MTDKVEKIISERLDNGSVEVWKVSNDAQELRRLREIHEREGHVITTLFSSIQSLTIAREEQRLIAEEANRRVNLLRDFAYDLVLAMCRRHPDEFAFWLVAGITSGRKGLNL